MCGIAGIIKIHDPKDGPPPPPLEAIPESWLDILDDSIKHRGPDGQGRFRDRATRDDGTIVDIALVHRRLSIIDHEGGSQPMVHDGDRLRPDLTYQPGESPVIASEIEPNKPLVAVVFNGCIYNHRKLRKELEAAGHVFETDHSDTEVLIHGWRHWQGELQDKLDAMYSFLLWDRETRQIVNARDFSGEKPLYSMTMDNGEVVYSSLISSLIHTSLTWNPGSPLIDPMFQEGSSWINNGFEQISMTSWMYQSIPNTWLLFPKDPKGSFQINRPKQVVADRECRLGFKLRSSASSVESMQSIIEESVSSRIESDVPLGVFLSGGVDSALIAAIAQRYRQDMKTFTVRMPSKAFDESDAALETAKFIGTHHTTLECDPNPASDLIELIEQLGHPFGDSSILPTYWVSKAARKHIKVALSGDGADELFGGYRRYTITPTLNRWRSVLKHLPTSLLNQRSPNSKSTYLARLATAARYGGYSDLLSIFPTPDLLKLVEFVHEDMAPIFRFIQIDDPLFHDFRDYLPDDLLRKTDTASMAVGLEVRAPFLAKDLVKAALSTPLDILMPNGERKGLLKQVARKYLPDHIVDRPKQGFAIPIGEWFRTDYGHMRQLLHDHLHSTDPFPGLTDAGVNINMKFVNQMLREHDAAGEKSINPWHGRDHSQRLYMLLVLSIWSKWLDRIRQEPVAQASRL